MVVLVKLGRSIVFAIIRTSHLIETGAARVHTRLFVHAVAAIAKLVLDRSHPGAWYVAVDESEVRGKNGIILFVDDCDGKGIMGGKRAKLAPMAVISLFFGTLGSKENIQLVGNDREAPGETSIAHLPHTPRHGRRSGALKQPPSESNGSLLDHLPWSS